MARGADIGKRISSFVLAGIFLITSVGFTAIIIWQSRNDDKKQDQQQALQEALDQQTTEQTNSTGENMLQGTQLANFTPTTAPVSELQIIDTVEGTGEAVPEGATITAHYTGALVSDGKIFQSSHDTGQPFTSPLSGLIEGWQKGIPGMKVGGTRRLVIPYAQAYGEAGSPPSIPEKADLVFDIELVGLGGQ